jgi:putative RecB family exonuclease
VDPTDRTVLNRAEDVEPSRLDVVKTMPRSVSQLTSFRECGYRFFLERVERVRQRPAAWFPQGTAVHRAAELWELTGRKMGLEEAQAVFSVAYEAEVGKYTAVTPRFDHWFASGPYGGAEDVERRYGIGLDQVAKYIAFYTEGKGADERPIRIGDEPAIELAFETVIGDVPVRGYIDAVMTSPRRGTVVRDNKTGAKPGKPLQLKVYDIALRQEYDVHADTGDFWMGKTGQTTRSPVKLAEIDDDEVASDFASMDEAVKREQFDPKPGAACERCSVAHACPFVAR